MDQYYSFITIYKIMLLSCYCVFLIVLHFFSLGIISPTPLHNLQSVLKDSLSCTFSILVSNTISQGCGVQCFVVILHTDTSHTEVCILQFDSFTTNHSSNLTK